VEVASAILVVRPTAATTSGSGTVIDDAGGLALVEVLPALAAPGTMPATSAGHVRHSALGPLQRLNDPLAQRGPIRRAIVSLFGTSPQAF